MTKKYMKFVHTKPMLCVFGATEREILENLKKTDRMADESFAAAKLRIEEDALNSQSRKYGMLNYDFIIEQESRKKSNAHLKIN